jgi:hypothetical protein
MCLLPWHLDNQERSDPLDVKKNKNIIYSNGENDLFLIILLLLNSIEAHAVNTKIVFTNL